MKKLSSLMMKQVLPLMVAAKQMLLVLCNKNNMSFAYFEDIAGKNGVKDSTQFLIDEMVRRFGNQPPLFIRLFNLYTNKAQVLLNQKEDNDLLLEDMMKNDKDFEALLYWANMVQYDIFDKFEAVLAYVTDVLTVGAPTNEIMRMYELDHKLDKYIEENKLNPVNVNYALLSIFNKNVETYASYLVESMSETDRFKCPSYVKMVNIHGVRGMTILDHTFNEVAETGVMSRELTDRIFGMINTNRLQDYSMPQVMNMTGGSEQCPGYFEHQTMTQGMVGFAPTPRYPSVYPAAPWITPSTEEEEDN